MERWNADIELMVSAIEDNHVANVVTKLVESVLKSAKDPERGDFAKGREQMAMHAIALLLGMGNWKSVEGILFGDSNGD